MNWLSKIRKEAGYTQEALAAALRMSAKKLQRWERYEPEGGEPDFARIAIELGVSESELRAAYTAHRADQPKEKTHSPSSALVDITPIVMALRSIASARFERCLLDGFQSVPLASPPTSHDELVSAIAEYIETEQHATLLRGLNRAISEYLKTSICDELESVKALKGFYSAILLASARPLPALNEVGERDPYKVKGAKHVHTLIFAIDATLGSQGYNRLKPANKNHLDESPNATLCADLTDSGADDEDAEEWASNFVKQVGELLGGLGEFPAYTAPNRAARFERYCSDLNDALGARNSDDEYLLARVTERIPDGVFDYIKEWLPDLYLFECVEPNASCSLMRWKAGILGAWMAKGLWELDIHLEHLCDGNGTDEEDEADSVDSAGGVLPTEGEGTDDEPRHQVTLTQGYWLADTACTQGLWQAVMGENPARFQDSVEQVSWDDCQLFLQMANASLEGLVLRLPTEAQWEYACRAGTQGQFSWGDTLSSGQANYNGNYPYNSNQKDEYRQRTVDVLTFTPNPWGLYQMHGNVLEWCADWQGEYPSGPVQDPKGPEEGQLRVLRGGSWNDYGRDLRSALRSALRLASTPDSRYDFIGLRLAGG